jgi:glycosyltransferase involved in cell wall biosynthesis
MKITFFGLQNSFDYFQIGGTESFVRRITLQLIDEGKEVDYILYDSKESKELNPVPGLTIKYFKSIKEALNAMRKGYQHIVEIYLFPKDRLKFAMFRRKNCQSISFHFIYFSWPDSSLKRKLYFSEAKLFPYNGKLFCISERQYDYVRRWAKNAVYLLPPVPEDYFLKPEEKPVNKRIKVTFLGRIDPGKGINEVIEILIALKNNKGFECTIYGIHIPEHKGSLKIHKWLKNQNNIRYIEVDRQKYTPAVEKFVKDVLKNTDIFLQPYQKLSSTIDTPLLLLEAMASLCVVVTKPFGNIPDIYGKSRFLISPERFVQDSIKLLNNISYDDLVVERKRLYGLNKRLNFITSTVSERFINAINE